MPAAVDAIIFIVPIGIRAKANAPAAKVLTLFRFEILQHQREQDYC